MKIENKKQQLNERGIATIESVLLLSIFVVFMTYCVGIFGVIHTGILNSISARAYAFETFRNRANLTYFRDTPDGDFTQTQKYGIRIHGVTTEGAGSEAKWYVTTRDLAKGRETRKVASRPDGEKANALYYKQRELSGEVNPVFIKTVYGICLNDTCGGS